MTAITDELAALRREIDAVDDRLHDMLMQRAQLVQRVQAAKAAGNNLFLRPGREAQILRRLLRRHQGSLQPLSLARIWRELLTGLYHLQGGISVAVHGGANAIAVWDAARGHFGAATPMVGHDEAQSVLGTVSGSQSTVGVVPPPEEGETDPWWPHLRGEAPGTPRVVARIPLVGGEDRRGDAYVLAAIPPEPSGEDVTLLVATVKPDLVSRQRVVDLLAGAGLAGTPLAGAMTGGNQAVLVEVPGFVAPDDARLSDFARDSIEAGGSVVVIGAYALPAQLAG